MRHSRDVISRRKMDASRLDGIARAFPELDLIGAHLGNPCWEEACSIAFKHPRVYFDLSGGTAHKLAYSRWRHLLMTSAEENLRSLEDKLDLGIVNKFVFGTDGPTVKYVLEFYENLFRAFSFPAETRELVLWRNAARMFGIEKDLEARAAAQTQAPPVA
jgi:predicted TIM-barrel fold metal-dependent hydrolase